MTFATKLASNENIIVERGDSTWVAPVTIRSMRATPLMSAIGDQLSTAAIPPFTSIMLDKRAPGMFTTAFAGPTAKLEWLAEMMVEAGVVATTARQLMSHDLISRVNERILRGNARFKAGTVVMSYPALFRVMLDVTGASSDRTDPARVVARVLTELLARVYSAFGVMMPYKSFFAQRYYSEVVANTSDLIRASFVATVTETLEVMRLGQALKEKEFAPAVVESVLGPNLINAANKLLAAEKYNRWMSDAAVIVGSFLRNADEPYLESLRDDGNLHILATNASFAFDAIGMSVSKQVLSPVHEHSELLGFAALRLRELRRYESISMDKFAEMYTSLVVKTTKGYPAGVFVSRNIEPNANLKSIILEEDSEVVIPMPSPFLDPYMPMLTEFTNGAFGGVITTKAAFAFAQHLMVRRVEKAGDTGPGQAVIFGMTEREMRFLALAKARDIVVSTIGLAATTYFGQVDGAIPYNGDVIYQGSQVYTSDPAEFFLLSGKDHEGNQRFVTKPQTYAEDIFTGILDVVNPDLYASASREMTIELPLDEKTFLPIKLSLSSLLTGQREKPIMATYVATDGLIAEHVGACLGLAIVAFEELSGSDDPIDSLMAEQIATHVHDLVSRYAKPVGFNRFMRTVQSIALEEVTADKRDTRRALGSITAKHALAVRLATALMVRTGVVPFGMHDDIVSMLSSTRAIERAATSDAFSAIINSRTAG